ncbi:DUF3492 domain-containing protein [Streptomyces sp. A7024]|uniref:D-inositol 3-phosphate glycosyltransferase n=1 Tax=Streptomyces coryli TaxID=1128680 RepID=A0A6G4UEZ1_9ACTN|nr:DUF3492 domain-containing protein [Streptomyces coryli]
MRIGLLAESGYPYAAGEGRVWCDRLVRGLTDHEFEAYCLTPAPDFEAGGLAPLPEHLTEVYTAPLWGPADSGRFGRSYGRRERQRFAEHFTSLATAITASDSEEDRFAAFTDGLYGLARLARDHGAGLAHALRSEAALRILESACRAPGSSAAAQSALVTDLLAVTDRLERVLRPLTAGWYGDEDEPAGGLAGVDLCHALSGGPAALPGLLAKHFFGTPLLVTEYGVRLRRHYLAQDLTSSAPVRALLAAFHRHLAAEVYAQAALLTPGNTHARRWQQRLGADPARQRTVYPGMRAGRFAAAGEGELCPDDKTLVWVGRIEPGKDLVALLHAFAEVRKAEPEAQLRIIGTVGRAADAPEYLAHCRAFAAQLFPDEAVHKHAVGDSPVSFEEIGGPEVPDLADAYAAGSVLVLSSVVEGFPAGLAEGMFSGRATVSTDVGAVREIIGGTGLVVPPRNPRALAEACLAMLRDPARRARLGAAARARALELFTVEQNIDAFRGIYLELMSHCPVRTPAAFGGVGGVQPFAHPAEAHVPGRWAGGRTPESRRNGRFAAWLPGRSAARGPRRPSWSRADRGAVATERTRIPEPVGAGARTSAGGAGENEEL